MSTQQHANMHLQSLVLVADDDPRLRTLITEFLSGHGYRVAAAPNATEMRRLMATHHPDLVILDVMMPGAGAVEVGEQSSAPESHVYMFAAWRLDVLRRILCDPTGMSIELSHREFALLRTFVEHPQSVLTRDQLLNYARVGPRDVHDRAIDTQISRLRRKLHERTRVEWIRTVHNQGYMFVPKVSRL